MWWWDLCVGSAEEFVFCLCPGRVFWNRWKPTKLRPVRGSGLIAVQSRAPAVPAGERAAARSGGT